MIKLLTFFFVLLFSFEAYSKDRILITYTKGLDVKESFLLNNMTISNLANDLSYKYDVCAPGDLEIENVALYNESNIFKLGSNLNVDWIISSRFFNETGSNQIIFSLYSIKERSLKKSFIVSYANKRIKKDLNNKLRNFTCSLTGTNCITVKDIQLEKPRVIIKKVIKVKKEKVFIEKVNSIDYILITFLSVICFMLIFMYYSFSSAKKKLPSIEEKDLVNFVLEKKTNRR